MASHTSTVNTVVMGGGYQMPQVMLGLILNIQISRHPERMFLAKVPYGPKLHACHICYEGIDPKAANVHEIVSPAGHFYVHDKCLKIATGKVAEISIE